MGMSSGMYCSPKNLITLVESVPIPAVMGLVSVGVYQDSMLTLATLMGLNVRTGMEDNVYIERGRLCNDNAELVEKVVRIAGELGRPIATPKQARQIMGLSETPSRY